MQLHCSSVPLLEGILWQLLSCLHGPQLLPQCSILVLALLGEVLVLLHEALELFHYVQVHLSFYVAVVEPLSYLGVEFKSLLDLDVPHLE